MLTLNSTPQRSDRQRPGTQPSNGQTPVSEVQAQTAGSAVRPERRAAWLAIGATFGFALAAILPSEPAYGQVVEGSEKFAMAAVPTITGTADAVFVLDYLTGRLYGAQYNPNAGRFTGYYLRNLADDFDLAGADNPQFTILPAFLNPRSQRGGPVATGGIYIGELVSGKVCCYGFSLQGAQQLNVNNPPVVPVEKIDEFSFRQAADLGQPLR